MLCIRKYDFLEYPSIIYYLLQVTPLEPYLAIIYIIVYKLTYYYYTNISVNSNFTAL